MTAAVLPQLQVVDKLRQIPLVGIACNTSADVYNRVKSSNGLITWTFRSAEEALALALIAVAPIANRLQSPIHVIDHTLCKGIELVEHKIPIVKEEPAQIYENAITYVSHSAAVERVQSITNKSWEKANEVLANTSYGSMAMTGLDTTSYIADRYIDYYLPAANEEDNFHPHPNSECNDKILHTVHTVGAISAKVGSRVYKSLSRRGSSTESNPPTQESNPPTQQASSTESTESSPTKTVTELTKTSPAINVESPSTVSTYMSSEDSDEEKSPNQKKIN